MYLLWFWFYDSQVKTALYSKCEFFSSHDSYEQFSFSKRQINSAVPDPDFEIKGAWSSRPLDSGGERSPKKFFRLFGPQFGLKIRGRVPRAPPLSGYATALLAEPFFHFLKFGVVEKDSA